MIFYLPWELSITSDNLLWFNLHLISFTIKIWVVKIKILNIFVLKMKKKEIIHKNKKSYERKPYWKISNFNFHSYFIFKA